MQAFIKNHCPKIGKRGRQKAALSRGNGKPVGLDQSQLFKLGVTAGARIALLEPTKGPKCTQS